MHLAEVVCLLDSVHADLKDGGQTEEDKKRVAAVELARELVARQVPRRRGERPKVGSPAAAYAQVKSLGRRKTEHLVALYLDSQNNLILKKTVSVGTLNTTRTHPREVLQAAIVRGALGFILAHNHPSGSQEPSQDDQDFTRAMKRAGELVGIQLYDHLIVSNGSYTSMKERGLI